MLRAGLRSHHREHLRRSHLAAENRLFVKAVYTVDGAAIPVYLRIKVHPKSAIQEDIDDISESNEEVKVKTFEQQGQDVLCSDAFEALHRTIVVDVLLLVTIENAVVSVLDRQFPPEPLPCLERFGPTLVAIAADHVACHEVAFRP